MRTVPAGADEHEPDHGPSGDDGDEPGEQLVDRLGGDADDDPRACPQRAGT